MPKFLNGIGKVGAPFYVEEGTNTRSWVRVEDLITVYMKLVEAAVSGGGSAYWGKTGYYFTASQEVSQLDIAKAAGKTSRSTASSSRKSPNRFLLIRLMKSRRYPGIGSICLRPILGAKQKECPSRLATSQRLQVFGKPWKQIYWLEMLRK